MNSRAVLLVATACMFGCRQDMHDQPKYRPLAYSAFFADGRSARPLPPNTIAVDDSIEGTTESTGLSGGDFAATIPVSVNKTMLMRGRERFDIYCSPCHSKVGDGRGIVAKRGFYQPMNLLTERIVNAPPGYLYAVITNGFGAMSSYRDQVNVPDRWAIVAYIRALELSQRARIEDVPADRRGELEGKR